MNSFEQVTAGAFWNDLGLPAQEHYDKGLAYHNWSHVLEVAENVCLLADRCKNRGIELHAGRLVVAAAWHDAGYAEDHIALGFQTKEHYSARLAKDFLISQKIDDGFIDSVVDAILGTIHGAPRERLDTLALHRADIANIGGGYSRSLANSYKLFLESQAKNSGIDFINWRIANGNFLEAIIDESMKELPRLHEPTEGPDSFPVRASVYKAELMKQTEDSLHDKAQGVR